MEARKGTIRERETRQVGARRKPDFSDNGDAEAGLRGRFQSGARRKPNACGSRREGGFTGTQVLSDREPGGPQALRELAAARGEGRKAGAVCGGTSLRLIAEGLG
jgi:hypothetical protein